VVTITVVVAPYFFLHVGGSSCLVLLLRCLVRTFRGRIDGAQRQSMTSVGAVTAEEGREKFLSRARLMTG
jgi:hypothetical protein